MTAATAAKLAPQGALALPTTTSMYKLPGRSRARSIPKRLDYTSHSTVENIVLISNQNPLSKRNGQRAKAHNLDPMVRNMSDSPITGNLMSDPIVLTLSGDVRTT